VKLDIDFGRSSMNIYGEGADIQPERARFIRTTVDKWEQEWLAEEAKKL
jgi:hypothetical protein